MEATQPVVSVIVPAYNVERFIVQALSSVQAQTLHNIEIICVNDGSTDGTLPRINDRAAHDDRIRVIDKENGGYGSACNCGIEAARGTWIAILEPDDWVEPAMYADMTDFAASFDGRIDIVKTPYWRIVDADTADERRLNCSYKGRVRPTRQPFTMADRRVDHLLIHHPSIWSAIYRRAFLDEHKIRFREIPGAGWADNPFLVETLCQAHAIAYLDRAFYCYREETSEQTESFAKRQVDVPFERWHDMMDVLDRIGEQNASVLRAQFRRGFTYLDYIGEGTKLDSPRVREIMERMFARMDDELVLEEPAIPPAWKIRYQQVKGIPMRRISPIPYAASLAQAGLYSLKNIGPKEALKLVGSVMRRDKAASGAGPSIVIDTVANGQVEATLSLSIIVPVYNAAPYLEETLDSLERQTYRNFEIICVDDGSTDGSRDILERYAEQDGRMRIIRQRNSGPSSARNTGIAEASGSYVTFLDADDLLEAHACKRLADALANGEPDVVAFGWSCFPEGLANRWLTERTRPRDVSYPWFESAILFSEMTNPYLRVAARRELLLDKHIAFDEGLRVGEDCAFLFSLFPKATATKLISDQLYRYRMPHEGSIMGSSIEGSPGKCLDDLLMAISIFGDWDRSGLIELYGHRLMHWFIAMQLYTVLRLPVPIRNELVALVKQLWLAHFTPSELQNLPIPSHDRTLVNLIASSKEDGALATSELHLEATLLSWRISEHGLGDLVRTAFSHLTGSRA